MKKKFKDTKLGKILLSKVGKSAIKMIPIVGGPIGNILDDNGTEPGKIDKKDFKFTALRAAIVVLLVIAFKMGWITMDEIGLFLGFF